MSYTLCPVVNVLPFVTGRNHCRHSNSVDGDLVGQKSLFHKPYEFLREPFSRTSTIMHLERRQEICAASPKDRKDSKCLGHLTSALELDGKENAGVY